PHESLVSTDIVADSVTAGNFRYGRRCEGPAGGICALFGDRACECARLRPSRSDSGPECSSDGRRAHPPLPRGRGTLAARAFALAPGPERSMRRTHRLAHRMLWPLLTLAVGLALALSLILRPPPDDTTTDP